jgi:hypothetical protein
VRQFNELQYSENLVSGLSVVTAEALRENVPLTECYQSNMRTDWYSCPTMKSESVKPVRHKQSFAIVAHTPCQGRG